MTTLTPQIIAGRTLSDADPYLADALAGASGGVLRWSADGSQVMLASADLGTLTLRSADVLPH